MRLRLFLFALAFVLTSELAGAGSTGSSLGVPTEIPGRGLPVVREHTYRMAGKIRLVMLWVGRDDVGSGVIKWRAAGDVEAIELLIGSDPKRAPGQLNKWGYLVEAMRGGESSVVGLISQENDDRLSDVKAGLKTRQELRAFDTIRGLATATEGMARVGTLYAPNHLTYHDADTVLADVLADTSLAVKRVPRSGDVRPGFLTSLTELITASLDKKNYTQRIRYLHGDRLYQLRLIESTLVARFERDGRTWQHVMRARFETGEAGSRSGTRFEIVYGASGDLAGIPIVISYQPKWWLQVDLVLNS
jgi:hypothetical protein